MSFLFSNLGPAVCEPYVQFVEQGDSATISCNATNVPREYMTCMTQGQRDSEKIANCSQIAVNNASVADGGYYSCVTAVISETNMASCYLQVIGELCLILVFIVVWKGLCITFNHVLQNSFWLQSVSLLEEIILHLK